jgi:hypoxanthine phosphoribosyltransferase
MEVLIKKERIQRRVRELARRINRDYGSEEIVFIGVLNGVVFFFADLVRRITVPSKIDFVRLASYGAHMVSSGRIRMTKDVELPIEDEHVVLVEDIVDTGLTLSYLCERLEQKGARSVRICALIDKHERRERDLSIDYCGFKVEKGFLVGYGLDCDERYRSLPDICILS